MSPRVPGVIAAELLRKAGLQRTDVVRGLMSEVGLSRTEAETAWSATAEVTAERAPQNALGPYGPDQ